MIDRKDHFFIGDFDGYKFKIDKEVNLNLPKNYYASQMFNYDNKIILIGWISNDNYKTDKPYNGVLSIPRIIEYKDKIVSTKAFVKDVDLSLDSDMDY